MNKMTELMLKEQHRYIFTVAYNDGPGGPRIEQQQECLKYIFSDDSVKYYFGYPSARGDDGIGAISLVFTDQSEAGTNGMTDLEQEMFNVVQFNAGDNLIEVKDVVELGFF